MNYHTFSLKPFADAESLSNLQITGNVARIDNHLYIRYTLLGNLEEIAIPAPANTPSRKHKLWENTCFEFFLGVKNSPQYWEFNLSPSGDWNVYRFDGYRQGMREETAFSSLPFTVSRPKSLAIALNINLEQIVTAAQTLELAITTVIKHRNNEITYLALTHQGTEPDFHRRDSFIIEL